MDDNSGQYQSFGNDKNNEKESPCKSAYNTEETSSKKRRTLRRTAGIVLLVCCCILLSSVCGGISAYVVYTLMPLFESEKTTSVISTEASDSEETEESINMNAEETGAPEYPTVTKSVDAPDETQPERTETIQDAQVTVAQTQVQQLSASKIYSENVNSVVGVSAYSTKKVAMLFGLYTTKEVVSNGSGFFVTSDGYIITNNHVVDGAHTFKVSLYDGSVYDAVLVGGDASNDVAVLKVVGDDFRSVELGESACISVGDSVFIVGNALGELSFSLTSGVVSYLNRSVSVDSHVMNMNQTDAAINVGNSGGPVFDEFGSVIGIASAKMSAESIEGLGFFIPIDDVKEKVMSIIYN